MTIQMNSEKNISNIFILLFSFVIGASVAYQGFFIVLLCALVSICVLFIYQKYPHLYVVAVTMIGILFQQSSIVNNFEFHFLGVTLNLLGLINGINLFLFVVYTVINRKNWFRCKLGVLLICFWGGLTISMLFSLIMLPWFLENSISKWIAISNWIITYFIVSDNVHQEKTVKEILVFYLIGIIILALSILYSSYYGAGVEVEQGLERFLGFSKYALVAGDLLAIGLIVCSSLILEKYIVDSRFLFLLFLLFFVALLFTGSRAPLLSVLIVFLIQILLLENISFSKGIIIGIFLILATIFIFSNERLDIINIINERSLDPQLFINLFGRFESWKYFLGKINVLSFLLGFGLGSAQIEQIGLIHSPHNDYIRLLYEIGIWGLLLNIIFFVKLFVLNYKSYKMNVQVDRRKKSLNFLLISIIPLFFLLKLNEDISYIIGVSNSFSIIAGLAMNFKRKDMQRRGYYDRIV
jgi:O-antigen ligase